MTAAASAVEEAISGRAEKEQASVVSLAVSSIFFPLFPKTIGKYWLGASLLQASLVGLFSLIMGGLWAYGVMAFSAVKAAQPVFRAGARSWTMASVLETARKLPSTWLDVFHQYAVMDKIAAVVGMGLFLAVIVLLPFFVLLPFAARPGKNSPCVRHVARTVLLGLGAAHLWGAALVGTYIAALSTATDQTIEMILFAIAGLIVWTFAALVRVVRLDYRGPADGPEPHDPWCDACGYNLIATDAAGRCPECGRPVVESTGAHTRPPTAWEIWPSIFNVPVIVRQLSLLVKNPRRLFYAMPTLTGQRAAQRWLLYSALAIALVSVPIFPIAMWIQEAEFSLMIVAGTAAMCVFWPLFALMMVGIETAGIATFSKMRGRPIYLAAAAKVTCYSSILMVLWVILGGTQMIVSVYWYYHYVLSNHAGSIRAQQIFLAVTLGVAHIGGLLWYELTVYRGIRAVQFANK